MELIFIYNADSGKWNGYMDMMHKVFSPKTYPCHLCAITYGVFRIEDEWKDFIATYPIPLIFLHKDEWKAQHHFNVELPAVVRRSGNQYKVVLSAQKMLGMDLKALKDFMHEFAENHR